jgi:hypothetical protein
MASQRHNGTARHNILKLGVLILIDITMAPPSRFIDYYKEEQDAEENEGLVSSEVIDHEELCHRFDQPMRSPFCSLGVLATLLFLLGVGFLALFVPRQGSSSLDHHHKSPHYQCPSISEVELSLTDNLSETMVSEYEKEVEQFSKNMTEFLQTFRQENFDHWGYTYEELKEAKRLFKTKYFAPYLETGATIFESAIGIGLNMYMTLEILNEVKGIEDIVVYGNEYLEVSAKKGNIIFDQFPPHHAKKGMLCQGDSTNLDFVPSNAFDLVFTGYVTPSLDPLEFGGQNNGFIMYAKICEQKDDDWTSKNLNELAQLKSEDWYAKWLGEMVRIAKPGAPVIVESVQQPFCKPHPVPGEGGVSKQWWLGAIEKYNWDIDPDSLAIEDDILLDGRNERYSVFMKKNGLKMNCRERLNKG